MSSIFLELQRSDRLLPVEDKQFLQRLSLWRVLFLDAAEQPALHEHVSFFRHGERQTHRMRWMHTLRSARVATRQVPFVRPAPLCEALPDTPPMAACERRVLVLAPYERRACPVLLYSPVRPAMAARLASTAAQLSLPAQSVFLFVSLTMAYLDAVAARLCPRPASFRELLDAVTALGVRPFLPEADGARRDPLRALLATALELWTERRGEGVTAAAPLGCLAAPLQLRDLHDGGRRFFAPCAARHTPRAQHPLRLAPLPPDPLLDVFRPAWEDVLREARRGLAVLAELPARIRRDVPNPFAPPHALPPTPAELADFICRAGAALWASPDPTRRMVLRKPEAQFAMAAVDRAFIAAALRLRQGGGAAEWRVRRAAAAELALTIIRHDGREADVGRPAAIAAGRTAMGDGPIGEDTKGVSANAAGVPLWLVAEGGFGAAAAFARHVCQSARPPVDVAVGAGEMAAAATTRAEEGVLHRIFQSHPSALRLAGCGARQLLLRAGDGQPFVLRVCGDAREWRLADCYDPNDASALRRPVRSVTAEWARVPPRGVPPTRLARPAVRGMLQHYGRALEEAQAAETSLFPVDAAVARFVARHHPHYFTRLRGCGVAEVRVRRQRRESTGTRLPLTAPGTPGGDANTKENPKAGREEAVLESEAYEATLIVRHPCGGITPFAYEECYNPVTSRLNRPQVLEGAEDDEEEEEDVYIQGDTTRDYGSRKRAYSPSPQ